MAFDPLVDIASAAEFYDLIAEYESRGMEVDDVRSFYRNGAQYARVSEISIWVVWHNMEEHPAVIDRLAEFLTPSEVEDFSFLGSGVSGKARYSEILGRNDWDVVVVPTLSNCLGVLRLLEGYTLTPGDRYPNVGSIYRGVGGTRFQLGDFLSSGAYMRLVGVRDLLVENQLLAVGQRRYLI